eukprot:1887752-Pleurochrysis_carterae.AAC.2
MRPRTQLAPLRLFVEYECPPHRVVRACSACFKLERAPVVLRVECELSGSPPELPSRRCCVPEFALVGSCTSRHPPDTYIQLLDAVDHHSPQVLPFFFRAPLRGLLPSFSQRFLDLLFHDFIPFRRRDIEETPCHRREFYHPCPRLWAPSPPHSGDASQLSLVLRAVPYSDLPHPPSAPCASRSSPAAPPGPLLAGSRT